jgi:DNA-binding beta-propeller fold protein YncE
MIKSNSESGRSRIGLLILALIVVVVVMALAVWGTRWTVPQAGTDGVKYEFVGSWDGTGAPSGKLLKPIGIGVAPNGDVYVTDARYRVIHFGASGDFKGEWGKDGDGPGEFSNPIGIVVASDGSVFVSDYNQDRVQKFTPQGEFILSFGSSGKGPGQFNAPAGVATDSAGNIYVADFYNHRIEKLRSDGSFVAAFGHPGRMGAGAVHYPTDMIVLRDGNLLVADAYNYELQWFDPQGKSLKRVGYHLFWLWPRLVSSNSGFKVPTSVAEGPDGLLHVADSGNHRVVMLTADGERVTNWVIAGANPNIFSPEHITVSPDGGTVYATDLQANRVLVLKVVKQGLCNRVYVAVEESGRCRLALLRRQWASRLTLFVSTSATACFPTRRERQAAFVNMTNMIWRYWLSSSGYADWGLPSTKFGNYWTCCVVRCSLQPLCAADWK